MSDRATLNGKALSLLIVWTLVLGAVVVLLATVAPPGNAAGTCSQVGGVINGNWVITTPQVCTGIVYTVDGSIYINAGGSLYLQDGGLVFSQDASHAPSVLDVNASASLTLDNSYITTQTNLINPYLKLAVTVQGAASQFNMWNGSVLRFPGTFTQTGGARLTLHDSAITGFTPGQISGLGVDVSDNDNSPAMTLIGSSLYVYRSQIVRMYENNNTGFAAKNLTLQSGSTAHVYDSYLSVDFSNNWHIHNELTVDATSNAYLFNVTVDMSQTTSLPRSDWLPAFNVLASGGTVSFLRWADVTVTDSAGQTVSGTKVTSRLSPSNTIGTYPDNGGSATPSAVTLAYLGKTAANWNTTDAFGTVLIPLFTDQITAASLPNAVSFGNYVESATYNPYSGATGVSFPPYPTLGADANYQAITVVINTAPICPGSPITWSTTTTFSQTISVSSSVVITGHITILNGSLFVEQSQTACAYVMVASGGSLTLVNASVSSNYPLVLAVAGTGALTASQSSYLGLSVGSGYGLLRSNATATVTVTDSTINGDVSLMGAASSLVRDTLLGPSLTADTSALVKLYDLNLNAVESIHLLTDLGSASSLALDIRNVTFNAIQTPQLQFGGTQDVQLTNVGLYDPTGTWYLNMISGSAVVSRFWWMNLNDVDGTGTLLSNANATILLQKINPVSLLVVAAPNPVPGDTIYFTPSSTWPVSAPLGTVLYRAFQDSWTANGGHTVDDTYVVGGSASVQGTTFYPDANVTTAVTTNGAVDLEFSTLTPDFSVVSVIVTGDNGVSFLQPLNRALSIQATITNAGRINVRNVVVDFFSTNVDINNDGSMDQPVSTYQFAGTLINSTLIPVINGGGSAIAIATWTFQGSSATPVTISVVVNPPVGAPGGPGAIPETNIRNNIQMQTVNFFAWPDLAITGPSDISFPADAVANNDVFVNVTVHNIGTAAANGATLLIKEGTVQVSNVVVFNILSGQASTYAVLWHPTTVGYHNITIYVLAPNGTDPRAIDYAFSNNWFHAQRSVLSQPDLALLASDYTPMFKPQNVPFAITVHVYNLGQTSVQNTTVAVYLNDDYSTEYGRTTGIAVIDETNVTVQVQGLAVPRVNETMNIVVNPGHTIVEGGQGYANNYANVTLTVTPPLGQITLQSPSMTSVTTFGPSDTIAIVGYVQDNTSQENPIPNLPLNISIVDSSGIVRFGPFQTQTGEFGTFAYNVILQGDLPDGTYTLRVASGTGGTGVAAATPTIIIHRNVAFLFQPVPLLGIQWWLMLVIIAAVAAIAIGVTVYFKVYGLGKMVECGECGAFIPEDATVCPKCGVEFEKDMAKCSNCQAWIPVDVRQCPECGVEFATGEVEMADYQEKMRLQYDEVVQKFKEDASRQLGRALSDKEFQEWWRKQPTFLTFEDWLREEEEMRKMGSRPCPVCGTLNSVTATVCHKCGSLMKEEKRPPSGGAPSGGMAPPARPRAVMPPGAGAPPTEPQGAPQAAPGTSPDAVRRVIRKPVQPAPVVQKKVIKRPLAEGEQASTQETTDQQQTQSDEQKQGDEL